MKKAFTVSEVVTTLVIIGVIGIMTVPSIILNAKEGTFRIKKVSITNILQDSMRNIVRLDAKLNNAAATADKTANQIFFENYLSKMLSVSTTCDPSDGITDCGFSKTANAYSVKDTSNKITLPLKNSDLNNFSDSEEAMWAGITSSGVSILVAYNPDCDGDTPACVNIIYDVNGADTPNQIGSDVGFMTIFYPRNPIAGAPIWGKVKVAAKTTLAEAEEYCDSASNIDLPNGEEAASIYYNRALLGLTGDIWGTENIYTDSISGGSVVCLYR